MSHKTVHPANHPVFAAFSPAVTNTPEADAWFLEASLYDIADDAGFVDPYDDYDGAAAAEADYLAEVEAELAFARSLEARSERGTWFGRDDYDGGY